MTFIRNIRLWQKVLLGMLLGIVMGYYFKEYASMFKPFGDAFMHLIKMVVVPLIFFSVLNGITNMSDISTFGRIGVKALLTYSLTTAFAVVIGLVTANIFRPGDAIDISLGDGLVQVEEHSIMEILLAMIPSNPINAMATGNIPQVVVFAFFTGFALILIGDKGREIKKFVVSATHLVFKMIEMVIKLTPYGVFAMMSWIVAEYGLEVVLSLGRFVGVVVGAFFIQYILFGFMLLFLARLNPLKFYSKILSTQMLAFATSSSKATLATAMQTLHQKLGVSRQCSSFVLPLGASMNMDGTAIYLGICSVFFAQIIGVELTASQYLIIMLTSTIGSIGAAGFPGGSLVMMSMVLSSVGLPLEGISLILGVDRFIDMLRTTINITGDCTVTVIIDSWEKKLNRKLYNADIEEDDDEENTGY